MRFFLLITLIALSVRSFAQSDGCSAATVIAVTANCSSPTSGSTTGATQTIPGCTGTADDDVWYQFTATSTSHQIVVTGDAGFDPVVQLFSGACASLVSLVCKDDGGYGVTETINYTSLTPGNVYYVRIYHYFAGSGSGNFTLCVTEAPLPPSNDECAGATNLTVNTSCVYTSATTDGATESAAGCSGFADDDVWFSFVATNSVQNVEVAPIDNLDLVFQVYSGSCGSLNSLSCVDNTFTSQTESSQLVGLIPGQLYYIRVYDYYQGTSGDFNICVSGAATAAPTNDEPCNAIQLPEVTATCQYSFFTTNGATTSVGPPTPTSCVGGSAPAQGGFQSGTQDVWFTITVPPSGNIDVTAFPNGGAGYITDGVMALYSGTCSSLTQIACSDDHTAYPGGANDLLPLISVSGLTPGQTVYLRYWDWGLGGGNFGICASTVTNDECANALYICDINGYSASTSASYTPDRPDNMRGNAEEPVTYNYTPGTNTGGIFGQGGPWGTGAPAYDVQINNNSWIKFTASSTTATLDVNIYDCWVGNYPSGGIQMQIFEGDNCTNFVPVSNFEESSTGFTITANNLTVGNDYYLMVDGFAGDICNYTITANSGVQFPDIADVAPICIGETVTLTAPVGATSYDWQHDGSTTQSVTVSPATTETYYCEVTGLCDYKQLLDVTVVVNPDPVITITNGATTSICNGNSVTLNATGGSTYSWSSGQSSASINVAPTSTTNYTVTGTDANGCTNTDMISVTVNPIPTLTVAPTATDSDCGGSNGSLLGAIVNGQPAISYQWTNGASVVGTSSNLNNIPAGNYYLNVTDGNMCTAQFGPYNVSNPGAPAAPTTTADDNTPCLGGSVLMTANSGVGGATYNWTGPNGFTSNSQNITIDPVTNLQVGNYCVSVTVAGCTGPSTCESVTISPNPSVDLTTANNDSTICLGDDISLAASGANSYAWSGPAGFTSSASSALISPATLPNEGYYYVTGTDSQGCSATDSMFVTVLALPAVGITADNASLTYCLESLASLTASGASSYSWTGPSGFTSSNTTVNITGISASDQGYYYVTGTDVENCNSTDSVYLMVVTDVPVTSMNDTIICPGEVLILTSEGGNTYSWTGPVGFTSNQQNPLVATEASFENSGEYIVVVADTNGCYGFDTTNVTVTNNENCLKIPNLVTPDGDFHNDTWEIIGLDAFEKAEVEIYNRWGNMVYYASPYNTPWDGTVNKGTTIDGDGKVPVGTYFYIIRLNEGDKPAFKGYVEVQF